MRARLARRPEDWRWSSARAHLTGRGDGLTAVAVLGIPRAAWRSFLAAGLDDDTLETIRRGERTGRPLGDAEFVRRLEATTGRALARRKPGQRDKDDRRRLLYAATELTLRN